jgi:hypothetical protein
VLHHAITKNSKTKRPGGTSGALGVVSFHRAGWQSAHISGKALACVKYRDPFR